MRVRDIDPALILPLHGVRSPERFAAIVKSMKAKGYQGRPVLAYVDPGDGYFRGLTGCHRIAAAKEAGLSSIRVKLISAKHFVRAARSVGDEWGDLSYALEYGSEVDRLGVLTRYGLKDAAASLRREIAETHSFGR